MYGLKGLREYREQETADLSTTLLRSSGRDDKGEGGASIECGCRTESLAESLANTKELSSRRFVRAEGLSCCGPSEQLSTAGKESLWNGKYEVRNATRMAQ